MRKVIIGILLAILVMLCFTSYAFATETTVLQENNENSIIKMKEKVNTKNIISITFYMVSCSFNVSKNFFKEFNYFENLQEFCKTRYDILISEKGKTP